jgi:hypothetical protein
MKMKPPLKIGENRQGHIVSLWHLKKYQLLTDEFYFRFFEFRCLIFCLEMKSKKSLLLLKKSILQHFNLPKLHVWFGRWEFSPIVFPCVIKSCSNGKREINETKTRWRKAKKVNLRFVTFVFDFDFFHACLIFRLRFQSNQYNSTNIL